MKKLTLVIKTSALARPYVRIDGKVILPKKGKNRFMTIEYETNNSKVEVELYKFYQLDIPNFKLEMLKVWLIGLFGLFSTGFDKRCFTYHYKNIIDISESRTIEFTNMRVIDKGQVFMFESNPELNNDSNIFTHRKDLEKRAKRFGLYRFISIIGFFIGMYFLIINIFS